MVECRDNGRDKKTGRNMKKDTAKEKNASPKRRERRKREHKKVKNEVEQIISKAKSRKSSSWQRSYVN